VVRIYVEREQRLASSCSFLEGILWRGSEQPNSQEPQLIAKLSLAPKAVQRNAHRPNKN